MLILQKLITSACLLRQTTVRILLSVVVSRLGSAQLLYKWQCVPSNKTNFFVLVYYSYIHSNIMTS